MRRKFQTNFRHCVKKIQAEGNIKQVPYIQAKTIIPKVQKIN